MKRRSRFELGMSLDFEGWTVWLDRWLGRWYLLERRKVRIDVT